MAAEPSSGAMEQPEKRGDEGEAPPPKPAPPRSSSLRKAKKTKSSSSTAAARAGAVAAASSPDPAGPSSPVPAKGAAAKASAAGTLAITVPLAANSGFPPDGGRGGGECRSFSQLLAGAMASPVGNSPILAVPMDAVRLPVVAVPCIIAPAALLESPGFTGQFAMTHQAVLATVTAQAQMQLQSGYTPPAMISSPVPIQQRPPSTSEDKTLSSTGDQPPSPEQTLRTAQIVLKTTPGDGFNWRKYGQKQVKSGDNSRSYYKCTQTSCLAKKKVERCQDGRVVEVIYRGGHNHDPPQKTKCSKERGIQGSGPSGDNEALALASGNTTGSEPSPFKTVYSSVHNKESPQVNKSSKEKGHQSSGPPEDNKTLPLASVDTNGSEPSSKVEQNSGGETSEHQLHFSNDSVGATSVKIEEGYGEGPDPKRRLTESPLPSPSSLFKTVKQPKVVVQTASDTGLVSDGYRWRKYGQKFVKGNPNPRSYYRCTQIGCPVRKHVERDSTDAKALIITYEGKHSHGLPPQKNDNEPPALLIAAAAAAVTAGKADRQTQVAKNSSGNKRPKDKPQPDADSKMSVEKTSELGADKTLESAQTLLSMGLKPTSKEEDDDRKSADAIQRPLFDENRAAVPVQNS